MTRRIGRLVGMAVVFAAAVALSAAQTLTGNWTMKVEGGPHGPTEMAISLTQEADQVKAVLNPGHGDGIELSGTFTKAELVLASEVDSQGNRLTMKATLKGDGTLSGYLSSAVGDMTWTARRVK